MSLPMPDPICGGCERPLSIHRLHRWADGGPLRAYCRPDFTQESPIPEDDRAGYEEMLEAIAEGRPL